MDTKWKIDPDDIHKGLIVISIIFTLSAFFIPIIVIYIMQDVLYFSRDHWFLEAPISAYIIFIVGMLIVPIMSILYFITSFILKKNHISINVGWLFLIASLTFIPMSSLGVMNYYYLDEEGLHYNHLLATEETTYLWKDIAEIIPYVDEEDQYFSRLGIITEDGREVELSATFELLQYRSQVFQLVENHGGEITERTELEN
ncbi:hypothetical protein [Salipaludibacillus daqingensis]|uniref:hypothetical protein n=1 Tax=Salipaludibacillus daqingensis TaxID=3041001 RepID=UPI00247633D3|nr:hypothetical protein [Salipaludibacillus daqingensis]